MTLRDHRVETAFLGASSDASRRRLSLVRPGS